MLLFQPPHSRLAGTRLIAPERLLNISESKWLNVNENIGDLRHYLPDVRAYLSGNVVRLSDGDL
jgi:hypothetical protein